MDKFNYLKEQLTAALATWQQTNGGKTTVGWMHAANPEVIAAMLAELEKAQRANNSAPAILRQLAEEKQKRGEVAAATAFNYAASALQKELSK